MNSNMHSGKLEETNELLSDDDVALLCDRCKAYGYCVERRNRAARDSMYREGLPVLDVSDITEREISNMVHVRTDVREFSTRFGKKLQQAHDLFHQDEFEQASYMYLDILETRNDCMEAWRGVCASFYFLGKYEESVAACMHSGSRLEGSFVSRFISGCELKLQQEDMKSDSQILIGNGVSVL